MGVDNVQAAIDQTCANIDSRLYNYTSINTCQNATTSTDIAYTGISYTVPANSIASITVIANYNNGYPTLVALSNSSTTFNMGNLYTINSVASTTSGISATANIMTGNSDLPLYVWAKYYNATSNMFCLRGYVGTLKNS